jgi:hypothetical protein
MTSGSTYNTATRLINSNIALADFQLLKKFFFLIVPIPLINPSHDN